MFSTGAIRPTSRHISRLRSRSRQFSSRSSQLQSSLKFSKRPHLSHSSFQIVTPSSIRLKSTWNPFAWGWAEPHKDAAPPTYEVPLATPTHDPTVPSIESVKNAAEPATAAPTGHMFESLPAGDTLGGQDLYEQLSTMAVNHVEPHIGFLKEAGLDFGWGPSSMIQWLIENVHVYGGMPWYGTLITCAVITRVLLLYPAMVTADQGARMGYFSKEAKEASDEMKATVMAGGDQNQATQVFTTKVTRLKHEYGFEGTKFAASLFLQIPIGFATFRVLRNLSETPGLGLASEGALWFQDLTVTDPTFILPVLMAGSMAAFMRYGFESDPTRVGLPPNVAAAQRVMLWVLPTFTGVFMMFQPTAMVLPFAVASMIMGLQNLLFRNAAVRQAIGLYPLPSNKAGASPLAAATVGASILRPPELADPTDNLSTHQKRARDAARTRREQAIKYEQERRANKAGSKETRY